MQSIDEDTFLKMVIGCAAICSAMVGAAFGYYGALRIKKYENRIQIHKDKVNQRLKFYLPLLRFSYELDRRLGHILGKLDTDWLDAAYLKKIKNKEGFAANPNEKGYFLISSIYLLACFFGWTEAIKKSGDSTKPFTEKNVLQKWLLRAARKITRFLKIRENQSVFHFDPDISTVSKIFQYEELFNDYMSSKKLIKPKDVCKLHKQLQYSIGELMLEKDGVDGLRCKSFREFFEAYLKDDKFSYWFIKLEDLFGDLSNFPEGKDIETQVEIKNDIRPLRLLAIRYWCRVLMNNMSKELDIETLPPDEVLDGVSDALKSAIRSVKIEKLESYLIGIRIENK